MRNRSIYWELIKTMEKLGLLEPKDEWGWNLYFFIRREAEDEARRIQYLHRPA